YRHAGREWSVGYRRVGLVARGRPVFDVRSADDAKSVFNAIHAEVRDRKRAGQRVHLCISGGRKSISAYGMAVAQLLFDHQDRLWHVASSERFQASGALHPTTAADASLVPVPVLALGLVHLAPMADLFATTEPQDLLQSVATAMAGDQRRRCRRFVTETLSTEERRLVKYFLSCVMEEHRSPTYGQIADALVLSERTVRNRFSSITAKLKLSFDYGASRVTTDVLVGLFAPHYFELDL
ncbi:MAG: CRISPR-associated ring nuclease, partial [Ardenticatenales bacterium]